MQTATQNRIDPATSTREKRVGLVAWRWTRQYRFDAEYKLRNISPEEIAEGDALGAAMAEEYARNRRVYGDPAYGSWPDHAEQPVKAKVLAMMRGETEPKPAPAAIPAPQAVVLERIAYSMVARVAKARTMARILHQGGLRSTDAECMTSSMWRAFAAGLRVKGILGKYSTTPPSADTIQRTIVELQKLGSTAAMRRVLEAA
jgi:hypothetical protein